MQEPPASVGGRPAVGNVLGFSLLLRKQQALLHLERRALAPGIRLIDYEAEVPGVEFPLQARGAAAFRGRRCRVRRLGLEVELRALLAWLRPRVLGTTLGGLRVDEIDLLPWAEIEPDLPRGPCLMLGGRHHGQRGWVMLALQVLPRGRTLVLRPWRTWRVDDGARACASPWPELAALLGGQARPDEPEAFVFDPVRHALLRPFVSAGWRVPDLGGLVVDGVVLEAERVELSLGRRGDSTTGEPIPTPIPTPVPKGPDRIDDALAQAYAALERAVAAYGLMLEEWSRERVQFR